jgi:hypothetical protein
MALFTTASQARRAPRVLTEFLCNKKKISPLAQVEGYKHKSLDLDI